MAWEKFIRTRLVSNNEPMISLTKNHFSFNSVAAKLAELKEKKRVVYLIDEENRKIGFDFQSDDEDPFSYSVFSKASGGGFRCSINDVANKHNWVRSVILLPDSNDRRFRLILEGKIWVVQLSPSFEYTVDRKNIKIINSEISGIYRYIRNNNSEIVYIGKGNIRSRYREFGRNEWDFDKIQYSAISKEDMQFYWENYWIEKYKEKNNGKIPIYNKISGNSNQTIA